MPKVSVTPEEFILVLFEHHEVLSLANTIVSRVGLTTDREVIFAINEATPLQRITVAAFDPEGTEAVTIDVEGGALEDPKRPRKLSSEIAEAALAKVLYRVKDRLDGSFADAPNDDKLTHAQMSAWNVYAVGRSSRNGFAAQQQRQRYGFRNRHAFSDASDEVFDQLWSAETLTWSALAALSGSVAQAEKVDRIKLAGRRGT